MSMHYSSKWLSENSEGDLFFFSLLSTASIYIQCLGLGFQSPNSIRSPFFFVKNWNWSQIKKLAVTWYTTYVSLLGSGLCNLLELELLHLVSGQDFTWTSGSYTGLITRPVYFYTSGKSLILAWQRITRVFMFYMGHGTWPVYFNSSLALCLSPGSKLHESVALITWPV